MSYSLGFTEEFFLAEGEPYDRSDLALNDDGNPVSLWSAIEMMREKNPEEWAEMARDLFDCGSEVYLNTEAVYDLACDTDRCSDLSSPVEVWIDPEGDFRVFVYDNF